MLIDKFIEPKIKVYAFVGPSGTGKSYRAQMVASEYNIRYIIDDGLLIKDNEVKVLIECQHHKNPPNIYDLSFYLNALNNNILTNKPFLPISSSKAFLINFKGKVCSVMIVYFSQKNMLKPEFD